MTTPKFHNEAIVITAYDWVPEPVKGLVRDLRLRWALEEAGFPCRVDLVPQGTQAQPENLARQPFGQIPTLTVGDQTIFESGACLWRIAEASGTLLPMYGWLPRGKGFSCDAGVISVAAMYTASGLQHVNCAP